MTTEYHPDPITEGFSHSGQRLVQLVALAAAGQQGYSRYKDRLRAAQDAREAEAERAAARDLKAAFDEARSHRAPAHDRRWLREANLPHVAQAWGAAVPYAADNASAASAVRKCEERLRDLHPHAMSHYDRFRDQGQTPLDAMGNAAPYFTRDPNVRTGDPAPAHSCRRGQKAGGLSLTSARNAPPKRKSGRNNGRTKSPTTSAVGSTIRDGKPPRRDALHIGDHHQPARTRYRQSDRPEHRNPTRASNEAEPAAEDFPHTIDQALAMTAEQPFEEPARKPPVQSPERNRRRNR
ncbi:hypothetical protein [Actinomadura xylanilytica]|uniref:hypothetical protein n=1 Tax=Actinomadura xylanilytica TaxID=887459 RepID=UPI00255B075C|nr:hypothetical protein [Actinomadura xylanilytica]MDL4774269.1 hypothetical protein [Actinomadura xylanilytica]